LGSSRCERTGGVLDAGTTREKRCAPSRTYCGLT
jgi:hypothetical protein